MNYLLPHIQRIPSRIVRDELAHEIAQKLAIDSSVLRQELRHAAGTRAATAVKAPAEAQITDAEKILIRALASARQMQSAAEHLSLRDGAEEEFDPARQAQFVLQNEALHRGLATESLAESLLNAGPDVADILQVPIAEPDRRMLASILLKEEEELTAEVLEAAVRALRRIHLRRRQEEVQRQLKQPGLSSDLAANAENKDRLRQLLAELETNQPRPCDPSLAAEGPRKTPSENRDNEKCLKQKGLQNHLSIQGKVDQAAGAGTRAGTQANDRRHSTYVLNSVSLCELHNSRETQVSHLSGTLPHAPA